ncbi:hypothetical protein PAXRUDRAFT_131552 [Paxillus rubicundulus Ve08.2h10]|uniref:Uncharacterized protein n=1 Tax=Paxillus rubicundulus Ve08.2h10 TaxID=930991 RepID=A0A0D0DWG5_9AGAM|nr:hypothetical protein PAXRUDRAFT_131552 [Paxillus rubicundulus Ve08.2h10]
MDPTIDAFRKVQDSETAAKQRFESFKMGGGAPLHNLHNFSKNAHARTRSGNNSISSFSSLSISVSTPSIPSSDSSSSSTNVPSNPPSKRPNSHHRRRSSLSTRRESAELMGVSLPDLPIAHSDDNLNLGDKDSIRRRALWALEGKPDLTFSKVEIPDITSPDVTKSFEFPTKPSFPPGSGLSGHGISSLMGKRDSFGKMRGSTAASKDQLGTLLEEEEEEEEDTQTLDQAVEQSKEIPTAIKALPAKTSSRPRPASLNLRPLSLVQGTVVNCATGSLPTPTLTPSPRPNGLRPLALTPNYDAFPINANDMPSNSGQQVTFPPSSKRSSYSFGDDTPSPYGFGEKRRSSISYKRSLELTPRDMAVLPSPSMTPIERKFSGPSDHSTPVEQPLTAAEQHFLFRSHNVLLARLTELERTLRNRSRPVSYASEASASSSEPSDEMLQLISDLKNERDELKRDVDGWRQRVADSDKQADMLAKRIEVERRDAWVARSRLGLLEVEKAGLEKVVEEKASAFDQSITENAALIRERDWMKDEIMKLNTRLKDADAAVDECMRLRVALEQERVRREELEKLLDDAGLLNTPTLPHIMNAPVKRPPFPVRPVIMRPRGLGFQSIDSESSTTDVESVDDSFTKAEFTLDAVAEEDAEYSEEDDGLAGYEDEEDSDLSFSSPGGSSIGSGDELDIKQTVLVAADDAVNRLNSCPVPKKPTHTPHWSLSKTWTFPRGKTPALVQQNDEIDRFFGCLDDVDTTPPLGSEEMSKGMFSCAFGSATDDDEMPPFILPSHVGVVVGSPSSGTLDIVPEEDEEEGYADDENDDLVGEEVDGGIRFTFNAPPIICVTPPPEISVTSPPEIRITPPEKSTTLPAPIGPVPNPFVTRKPVPIYEPFDDGEEDAPSTFRFPGTKVQAIEPVTPPAASSPSTSDSGSRPASRNAASPSSIPRATSLRSFSPRTPPTSSTPSKSTTSRFTAPMGYSGSAFVTPPLKSPSFIPQPVTSPTSSKYTTSTKVRMLVSSVHSKQGLSGATNGSTFKPQLKLSMSTPNSFFSYASQPTIPCPHPDAQGPRKVAVPRRR